MRRQESTNNNINHYVQKNNPQNIDICFSSARASDQVQIIG